LSPCAVLSTQPLGALSQSNQTSCHVSQPQLMLPVPCKRAIVDKKRPTGTGRIRAVWYPIRIARHPFAMVEHERSREELVDEVLELRSRVAELEAQQKLQIPFFSILQKAPMVSSSLRRTADTPTLIPSLHASQAIPWRMFQAAGHFCTGRIRLSVIRIRCARPGGTR
jgi:hypothetical protein